MKSISESWGVCALFVFPGQRLHVALPLWPAVCRLLSVLLKQPEGHGAWVTESHAVYTLLQLGADPLPAGKLTLPGMAWAANHKPTAAQSWNYSMTPLHLAIKLLPEQDAASPIDRLVLKMLEHPGVTVCKTQSLHCAIASNMLSKTQSMTAAVHEAQTGLSCAYSHLCRSMGASFSKPAVLELPASSAWLGIQYLTSIKYNWTCTLFDLQANTLNTRVDPTTSLNALGAVIYVVRRGSECDSPNDPSSHAHGRVVCGPNRSHHACMLRIECMNTSV